jgi:hypothetical protein
MLSIYTHDGTGYLDWWFYLRDQYPRMHNTQWSDAKLDQMLLTEYKARMVWGRGIVFENKEDMLLFMLEWL